MLNIVRILKNLSFAFLPALIIFCGTSAQAMDKKINEKFYGGILRGTINFRGPGNMEFCDMGGNYMGELMFRGSFRNATIAMDRPEVLRLLALEIDALTNGNEVFVRYGHPVTVEDGKLLLIDDFHYPWPLNAGDIIGVSTFGLPELPGYVYPSVNDSFNNGDYRDGELDPQGRGPAGVHGETFQADFFVCLRSLDKFTFFVNIIQADGNR